MASYLTDAKKSEIIGKWHGSLPKAAITLLLEEIEAIVDADSPVKKISATIAYTDFTDNLDATGTYEFTEDLPAGAQFLYAVCTALTGFAGDTSATMTLGDGTDVDRYHAGTPNVFTTAATGIALGDPSGEKYQDAAETPTLIVTSGADFTSVNAGSITLDLFYLLND